MEVVTESVVSATTLCIRWGQSAKESFSKCRGEETLADLEVAVSDRCESRLSVLDAANSSHHRKQVGEKKIGRMIVSVLVIGPANVELQEVTES